MYDYIFGIVENKTLEYVSLDINGLGYILYVSFKSYESIANIGEKQKLYVHQHITENDMRLYGFINEIERKMFKKIISISGIGPKIAISILSVFTSSELSDIISNNDYKQLSTVPGLGVKKAQKLIIELRDKVDDIELGEVEVKDFNIKIIKNDIRLGLDALGYNKVKIEDYISDEEIKELGNDSIIMKEILKKIAKKK